MYGVYKPFITVPVPYLNGEIWAPIFYPGYNIKPYYVISNYGRIYSYSRHSKALMNPVIDESGYYRIQLSLQDRQRGRYFPVHRLVMCSFCYIDGCEDLQVNHIDLNKLNNHISNLEWCTCKENIQHAIAHGIRVGENNPACKVTDNQVHEICKLWEQGKLTAKQIADIVGTTERTVFNIANGSVHIAISSQYNMKKRCSKQFIGDEIVFICEYLQNNKEIPISQKIKNICELLGKEYNSKTSACIYHIYNRDTNVNISKNYAFH